MSKRSAKKSSEPRKSTEPSTAPDDFFEKHPLAFGAPIPPEAELLRRFQHMLDDRGIYGAGRESMEKRPLAQKWQLIIMQS